MLRLVIANKNYSSWSLRPWLLLRALGIPFEEIQLKLHTPEFERDIGRYTPTRRVPVLLDGEFAVWDSLAIIEYVHELHPTLNVWPAERQARARARSMCAEMHAGFAALRGQLPMNVRAHLPGLGWNAAVQRDVDRLVQMWRACLEAHGGPFLFGSLGAADAYFAPVVARFVTYAIDVPPDIGAYRDLIYDLPAMRAWVEAGRREVEVVPDDEPYLVTGSARGAP